MKKKAEAPDLDRMMQPFQGQLRSLSELKRDLESMEPGRMRVQLAIEIAGEIKRFRKSYKESELANHLLALHRAHRYFSSNIRQRLLDPTAELWEVCNRIRADWEIARRQQLEQAARQREGQLKLEMELERDSEVAHLHQLGRHAEAEARQHAALAIPAVSVDPDEGKPAGESMIESWVPARDANEEIIFDDLAAYLHWVADNPAMHHLIDHKYGKLKKLLTDNRGLLQPPGLRIEHRFDPRTLTPPTGDSIELPELEMPAEPA